MCSNYRAESDIRASRVKENSLIFISTLFISFSVQLSRAIFSTALLLYLVCSTSRPEEEEQGQAPFIFHLITLVMLHIIGKRWAKWTNKLSDRSPPSPCTHQSQGHLGKGGDTDVGTEQDGAGRKGELLTERRKKKSGQRETFPAFDLFAGDMRWFL